MRRNLWVLDLILLVAVVVSGFMLKQRQNEIFGREQAFLRQIVPAVPPPALPSIPGVSPITAANYMETVQMMLFSRDRNPNVILDPPPPPPPPPQMPPLPVAYGVMDLGRRAYRDFGGEARGATSGLSNRRNDRGVQDSRYE